MLIFHVGMTSLTRPCYSFLSRLQHQRRLHCQSCSLIAALGFLQYKYIDMSHVRSDQVRKLFQKLVDMIGNTALDDSQMAQCFPTIAHTPKGKLLLHKASKQLKAHFHEISIQEIDMIFEETHANTKFDELDDAINHAKLNITDGTSPLNLESVLLPQHRVSNIVVDKAQEPIQYLQSVRDLLRLENEKLATELVSVQTEIQALVNNVADFESELAGELDSFE